MLPLLCPLSAPSLQLTALMPAQQQLLLQQAQAQLLAAAVQQSNAAAAAASSQQPGAELPAQQNQPQTPQLALSQPIQLTAQVRACKGCSRLAEVC